MTGNGGVDLVVQGRITGIVADPTGAAIPGTSVELHTRDNCHAESRAIGQDLR